MLQSVLDDTLHCCTELDELVVEHLRIIYNSALIFVEVKFILLRFFGEFSCRSCGEEFLAQEVQSQGNTGLTGYFVYPFDVSRRVVQEEEMD